MTMHPTSAIIRTVPSHNRLLSYFTLTFHFKCSLSLSMKMHFTSAKATTVASHNRLSKFNTFTFALHQFRSYQDSFAQIILISSRAIVFLGHMHFFQSVYKSKIIKKSTYNLYTISFSMICTFFL